MNKLQQAKEALLDAIIGKGSLEVIATSVEAYNILCQTVCNKLSPQ